MGLIVALSFIYFFFFFRRGAMGVSSAYLSMLGTCKTFYNKRF